MNGEELNIQIINIFLLAKDYLPNSKIGMFLFLFFKFKGIILLTNSLEFENKATLNTYNIFQTLTYYSSYSRNNLNFISYELTCSLLFIILLFPWISFVFVLKMKKVSFKSKKQEKVNNDISISFLNNQLENSLKGNSNQMNTFIITVSILYFIIIFFSQHIIEILSFVYSTYLHNSKANIEKNKIHCRMLWTILNSVFIIIVNIYTYIFYVFFNNPSLSSKYIFKHNHSNTFILLLLIVFNSQSVHYYPILISQSANEILVTILFDILLILLLFNYSKKYTEFCFYNVVTICFILFGLYSSVISIIMISDNSALELHNSFYILKYVIVLILIHVTLFFWKRIQNKYMNKKVLENIFVKSKNIDGNYIYRLVELIKHFSDDIGDVTDFIRMIGQHQSKCTNDDECSNDLLNIKNLYHKIKDNPYKANKTMNKRVKDSIYFNRYSELLFLVENEIANLLYSIYNNNQLKSKMEIMHLHCNYVFYYLKNPKLSLFLIQQYLYTIKVMPFEYQLHFIQIKKDILLHQKEDILHSNANTISVIHHCMEFIKYYNIISSIKQLLYSSCNDYQDIIMRKNYYLEYADNVNGQNNIKSRHLEMIYKKSLDMSFSFHKIKDILKLHFINQPLKNPEVCYLLSYFYKMISRTIPLDVSKCFIVFHDYDIVDKFSSAYDEIKFEHPFIFSLSDSTIKFISQKLANDMKYKYSDLIGQNFHILLPSIIQEQHSLLIKQQVLAQQISSIEHNIFLLDKERFYYKAKLTAGIIPTLESEIIVISDISINPHPQSNYLFISDLETRLIAMSSNFEEKYKLTIDILNKLKINFCSLFTINYEKMLKGFKHQLQDLDKSNYNFLNEILPFEYRHFSNIISIFKWKEKNKKPTSIKTTRTKQVFRTSFQRIKAQILEQELDYQWIKKVAEIEESLNAEINVNPNSCFEITIQLHHIGNCGYFYIKVYDKDEYMFLSQTKKNYLSLTYLNNSIQNQSIGSQLGSIIIGKPKLSDSALNSKGNIQQIMNLSGKNLLTSSNRNLLQIDLNSTNRYQNNSITTQNLLSTSSNRNTTKQSLFPKSKSNLKQVKDPLLIRQEMMNNQIINHTFSSLSELIITFGVLFLVLCGIVLLMFSIYYKSSRYEKLKDFFEINVILIKMKQYIIESSLSIISGCLITDGIISNEIDSVELPVDTLKILINHSTSSYFAEYKNLNSFCVRYADQPLVLDINEVMYKTTNFTSMGIDYSIETYESDLNAEIYNYHYSSGVLNRNTSFLSCRVRDYYIDQKDLSHETPSFEDKLLYYINNNVLSTFMSRINGMIVKANQFLQNDYKNDKHNVQLFNIVSLVDGIVIFIGFFAILIIQKRKIELLLNLLFKKNKTTLLFEKKLENFKTMIISLDNKTYFDFENTTKSKNVKFESTPKNKDIKEKLNVGKEEKKTKHTSNNHIKKKGKICNEPFTKTPDTQSLNIKVGIMSFTFIRSSFILIIICCIIHLAIHIINIYVDKEIFYNIYISKKLAYYYLDRTPSLNEVLFYHRISILNRDPNFIDLPLNEYSNYLVSFEPKLTQNILERDQRFVQLNESKAGYLHYRIQLETQSLSTYEHSRKRIVLKNRYNYAMLLRQESGVCDTISSHYVNEGLPQFEGYNESYITYACLHLDDGVGDNGSTTSIMNYFSFLMDEYLDFVSEYKQLGNNVNIVSYIDSSLYIEILYQMQFIYNISWGVTANLIKLDFKILFDNVETTELLIQIIALLITLIYNILLFVIIILSQNKKIQRFGRVVQKLNHSL